MSVIPSKNTRNLRSEILKTAQLGFGREPPKALVRDFAGSRQIKNYECDLPDNSTTALTRSTNKYNSCQIDYKYA